MVISEAMQDALLAAIAQEVRVVSSRLWTCEHHPGIGGE